MRRKQWMKKTVSLLVALVMLASMIPAAYAEEVPPTRPTATITELDKDDLTFAMKFTADEVTDEQLAYYGDWYADFELTVNKDVTFNADSETADGYLSGEYGEYGWVNVPPKDVTLAANTSLKIMAYAAELMGESGLKYTYREVYEGVKEFNCGVFFTEEFLTANPDLEVTLELRMYNPADEKESYVIGDTYVFTLEAPELPTATVTDLEKDDLTFAMNFKADEVTDEQLAYYRNWYADFELTVNKDVTFNADSETADGYLSGEYGEYGWVNVPPKDVTLAANTSLKIMAYAAELMGEPGLKYTYGEVYEVVKDFNCGVFFTPEFLAANPDLEVTLELRMYNPADEKESYVIGDTYVFTLEAPELPTATVADLEKDDLTFAMNFKADEVTDEQLAYYSNWYADFELTVNKDVTFNADSETADGYLSGEYGEWGWINVPFEDVTLEANVPLKIMAYAAELMGEPGLKYTYKEVYEVVKDFNCGVFFTPEFLAANPDLEVTLELRMYNPADEEESYVIGKTYVFKAPTVVAAIDDKGYETLDAAFAVAKSGEIVRLLKDITTDGIVVVSAGITLDLNGKTLDCNTIFSFGDVKDSKEGTGLLKLTGILKDNGSFQNSNSMLPIWDTQESGYRLYKYTLVNFGYNPNTASATSVQFAAIMTLSAAGWEAICNDNDSVKLKFAGDWGDAIMKPNFVVTDAQLDEGMAKQHINGQAYAMLTLNGLDSIAGKTLNMTPVLTCGLFEVSAQTIGYDVPAAQ